MFTYFSESYIPEPCSLLGFLIQIEEVFMWNICKTSRALYSSKFKEPLVRKLRRKTALNTCPWALVKKWNNVIELCVSKT